MNIIKTGYFIKGESTQMTLIEQIFFLSIKPLGLYPGFPTLRKKTV